MATLHVNKLAAARRQLQAAIRLHFLTEDELAVHTVAAAAYGLLKDIKKSRGTSEAADVHLASIFYVVRDYHRGTLPSELTSDPIAMEEIRRLAELLSPINADSKLTDLRASIGPDVERSYWNKTNRAANFLKHADRDSEQAISLDTLNNELLLLKCCNAYTDVAPDDLGNEGLVFQAYVTASNESYRTGTTSFDSLVSAFRSVPLERRFEVCSAAIRELNSLA